MSREYSIRHVVRQHADADTQQNTAEFPYTPSQACLVWWGLHLLSIELRKPIPGGCWEDYSDTMRCYADAIDWIGVAQQRLLAHARTHQLEISPT
jgi:hypothetical protein